MEEKEVDIFEELVAQKIEEAKEISLASLNDAGGDPKNKNKANPLLTVNELVKTRTDILAREAELQLKEKEIKNERDKNINELIKTVTGFGASVIGTVSFGKLVKMLLKFEETGHAVTTATGRTLLSCLKIFKK